MSGKKILTLMPLLLISCAEDSTNPSSEVDTSRTYVDMRVSTKDGDVITAAVQLLNCRPFARQSGCPQRRRQPLVESR